MTNHDVASVTVELDEALNYYDKHANRSRIWYLALRVVTMILAAAIPVVAVVDGSSVITAVLGSAIVVTEGLQQLFQFHNRWVDYRSAWSSLERERRLHLSRAGPYADAEDPDRLLAERIEEVIESENVDWASDTAAVEKQRSDTAGS